MFGPGGPRCACREGAVTGYIGFDCTAPSLHVGNLMPIMMLHWMQKTGHKPIALMGGGTTRVGDPTGKDESRKILSAEEIEANKRGIQQVFAKFLKFGDSGNDALMVDNAEWLLALNYVEFLREVGRHISVNQMIQRNSVKLRLEREQHLSFLEFNYMVLQAYDFVELARRHGCRLQLGGSDQWGNIVAGVDLGRRMENLELFAFTSPLVTTVVGGEDGQDRRGRRMAQPRHGLALPVLAVLAEHRRRRRGPLPQAVHRAAARRDRPARRAAGSEVNEAKKVLATEATALLHGRAAAEEAAEAARRTFEEGTLADALPTITLPAGELAAGIGVLALFVRAGLVASNGEARRQIRGGGLRVNDQALADETANLSTANLVAGAIKLSLGRKKHVLVKPE